MNGYIGVGLVCIVATAVITILVNKYVEKSLSKSKINAAEELSKKILSDVRKEAASMKREAQLQVKEGLYQAKAEFEQETKERRQELQALEKRLTQKEENLDKKVNLLELKETEIKKREKRLEGFEKNIAEKEQTYQQLIKECRVRLEKVAGISSEEAKQQLLASMEEEAKHEAAKRIKEIEEEAKETSERRSKRILSMAIQRYAGDYVPEQTVSVVTLPNDEMKGRIIGREGRNIRALEAATGIDLIIDDTPEAVILSGYNPVRREVARLALERLISDGRIHPTRIEEVVKKAEQEIETTIREAGERAVFDTGLHGIHPELLKLVGRLKFRTSYSQNQYQHSLEVSFLCGIMAAELGMNEKLAKRAGLLHDIGKAVDHEVEGGHAHIGGDLAKKYGESPEVLEAISGHHDDEPQAILAVLVQAADSLSGARPGARREMFETYVKRLEDLERISTSFQGVGKAYAIQAGREVRVMVEDQNVSDANAVVLCRDIAKKIEEEMSYPGQIKVTVIRETRAVEYAK